MSRHIPQQGHAYLESLFYRTRKIRARERKQNTIASLILFGMLALIIGHAVFN